VYLHELRTKKLYFVFLVLLLFCTANKLKILTDISTHYFLIDLYSTHFLFPNLFNVQYKKSNIYLSISTPVLVDWYKWDYSRAFVVRLQIMLFSKLNQFCDSNSYMLFFCNSVTFISRFVICKFKFENDMSFQEYSTKLGL